MSVLQTLREKAGWLVAVVIGLALLIFVVSDFFGNGSGNRKQAKKYYEIATIDNESVSYQEYDARMQNLTEIYRMSGNQTITEELSETIRSQIWEQMVRERVLGKEYKRLGLEVSDDELDAMVMGDFKHPIVMQLFSDPQTGMFNESYMINFLKGTEVDPTAKSYWLFFENEIVSDRMNTKYNNMIANGLYVTRFQAEFEQSLAAKSVDFTYAGKYYNSIPDSAVTVTKDDIKKYYNSKKEEFKRKALRDIEYVTFDIVPSEDDFKEALNWITRIAGEFATAELPEQFINLESDTRHVGFYRSINDLPENLREFAETGDTKAVFGPILNENTYSIAKILEIATRPDSVRARHILLTPGATRTMAGARTEADSLVNVLKKGGSSFEILALMLSDDQGSAQTGGDLGWFPEGMMVIPFNNACFTGNKGEIVLAETDFGVHIIEILDQSPKVKKYNMGVIDRTVVPGSATVQKIYGEASQFAAGNPTHELFTKSVAELGLTRKIASEITPEQKEIAGLENPRQLIMSLFESQKGKIVLDNNQQAVFEIGEKYVVAFLTKIQEEGYAPMQEVESEISFKLLNRKKADLIAADFNTRLSENKSIETISMEMGLNLEESAGINFRSFMVQGAAGAEPALIAAAAAAADGVVTGPVIGNNGVYVLTVNNSAVMTAEEVESVKERLASMMQIRASYEVYEALRKEAGIVDKRYRFF
jgi:peptidyl-prolyl cis-trans isomerase D